jgi:FKBP-type peptidyl-prolyl cis-trans isomerase FkpA
MKKNLMFLVVAAVGFASCNGGFKQAPGGMLYNIHVDKSGPKIKEGDFLSVNVVAKTEGDSVLMSTYEQGIHSNLVYRKSPPGDVMSVFPFLTEGDSVTVKTNIDSVYKKGMRRPPFKGKYIVYELKVEKVIPHGNAKPNDTTWNNEIKKYLAAGNDKLRNGEAAKMKKYIDDNKLVGTTTPSGLFYVVDQPGVGDKPAVNDTAKVYYTVKFLNGKILETNIKEVAQKNNNYNPGLPYKPIPVPVGVHKVIPGWDEGLQLMNKGEKATFVIPSKLAYGEQGYAGAIPPYSTLVFNIQIVDIVHPNPNAPKPASLIPPQPSVQVKPVKPAGK